MLLHCCFVPLKISLTQVLAETDSCHIHLTLSLFLLLKLFEDFWKKRKKPKKNPTTWKLDFGYLFQKSIRLGGGQLDYLGEGV